MSLIIQYCEKCGERVSSEDIQAGVALHYRDESYCKACKDLILPELEQDPEFQKFQAQQKHSNRAASPSVRRRASSSGASESSRGAKNNASQRQSGGSSRRGGGRRNSGVTNLASPSSRKASGKASTEDNNLTYIVCGVGALIVIIVIAIMMSSGDDATEEVSESKTNKSSTTAPGGNTSTTTGPAKTPKQTPKSNPLERKFRKLLAYRKRNPDNHKSFLGQLAQYLEEARGTEHERLAMDLRKKVRASLNDEAQRTFATLKKMADQLVSEGSFLLALEKWDDFSPELRTLDWVAKIDLEKKQIEQLKKRQEENKFTRGTPPPGGETVEIFNGNSLAGWSIQGPKNSWSAHSGVLTIDNTGNGKRGMGYVFHRRADKNYWFKDFYLSFECQLGAGTMSVLGRIASSATTPARFDAYASSFEPNKWYKAHLVVRGNTAEWWIEKASSLMKSSEFTATEGAFGINAEPGTKLRIRGLLMRVLTPGSKVPPPTTNQQPDPSNNTAGDLFNGKDLKGWRVRGGWKVVDGVITADGSLSDKTSMLIKGGASWKDYKLTFEVKAVGGDLSAFVRVGTNAGSGIKFNEKLFPNKNSWYKMELTARGDTITFHMPLTGQKQDFKARTQQGQIGFAVKKGSSCLLRNIRVTLLKE